MTDQSLTQPKKTRAKELTRKECLRRYYLANKEKLGKKAKQYRHSKEGLVTKIYGGQRRNSRRRNHPMPDYNLEELRAWMFGQPSFEELYQSWVKSDFDKMQVPSCDRIDDYQPYTLDNLKLVTWQDNFDRGHADRKAGINNKASKAVIQLTKDGEFIAEHHSSVHASRVTGVHQGHLSESAVKPRPSGRGYKACP